MFERVIGFAALLASGLLAAWLFVVLYTLHMLTHPPRRTYASALSKGRPGDPGELFHGGTPPAWSSWEVAWNGLSIPAWSVTGGLPGGPCVVMLHGWGDSRIGSLSRMPFVLPHVSSVVAVEFPGHGLAPGVCTLGTREVDLVHAVLHATPSERIVLFGWSMGAGVAIAAALDQPRVRGVIAESPYALARTPASRVLSLKGLPWRGTLGPALAVLGLRNGVRWEGFDRAEMARRLRVPLLVLHGEDDEISPVEDARAIAWAAGDARLVILPGGHTGLWTTSPAREQAAAETARFLTSDALADRSGRGAAGAGLPSPPHTIPP